MKSIQAKPEWLHKQVFFTHENQKLRNLLQRSTTHTVCQEARCPNLSECYNAGTATFMILGRQCTRSCRFCAVESVAAKQREFLPPPDQNEAQEIARLVDEMKLRFAVITSVARDDLEDEGASHFAKTLQAIKTRTPLVKCEVLTPDFHARRDLIRIVLDASPEIFNHNIETVQRLSNKVRHASDYRRSLSVLEYAKQLQPDLITKSGLMLGFGETNTELTQSFRDLALVGCDIVTIGQYLQPTKKHLPVHEYVAPERYNELKARAQDCGIKVVYAGAFVRSSYKAHESYLYLKTQ